MAVWAYACHPCHGESPRVVWYVAVSDCEQLSPDTRIVRVKVGDRWRSARLDRRPVEVEGLLVRQVVGTDARDCAECEDPQVDPALPFDSRKELAMQIQAAAVSLLDHRFMVVAAQRDLLQSPGEADMAIEQLQAHFRVPVVLMAQSPSGSPTYYGDAELVELLRGVPLDKMPWQEYSVPA